MRVSSGPLLLPVRETIDVRRRPRYHQEVEVVSRVRLLLLTSPSIVVYHGDTSGTSDPDSVRCNAFDHIY